MAKKSRSTLDREILDRATRRVESWFTYWRENNNKFNADSLFCFGEDGQWTPEQIKLYGELEKPRMTFNLLPKYILNVLGEEYNYTPDIVVDRVGKESDNKKTQSDRDIVNGLMREIVYGSKAETAQQINSENALKGGYGAMRIMVVPEAEDSPYNVIRLKAIKDPTSCFWDPNAEEIDKTDGEFCGTTFKMLKDTFIQRYPNVKDLDPFVSPEAFYWMTNEYVLICDYYEKEWYKDTLLVLEDGQCFWQSKISEDILDQSDNPIIDRIPKDRYRIKYYQFMHNTILERADWDGTTNPIIYRDGFSTYVAGTQKTMSFIHWAKDPQRAYNFVRSEYLYRITTMRGEGFMGTPTMVEGYEDQWRNVHQVRGIIKFNPDPLCSGTGGVPKQIMPTEVPQSLQLEMQRSPQDIQNILGRYEANLGDQGGEVAAIAIRERGKPANLTLLPFFYSGLRSLDAAARAIVELIPIVYDTKRLINVRTSEGGAKALVINDGEDSTTIVNKKFKVEVRAGISFAMQRAEAADKLLKLMTIIPQLGGVIPDKAVESFDLPNQHQIVDRVQKYLIPNIIQQEEIDAAGGKLTPQQQMKQKQIQAQQMQQQQMQQQIQQLQIQMGQAKVAAENAKAQAAQAIALAKQYEAETKRIETMMRPALEKRKEDIEILNSKIGLHKEMIKTAHNVHIDMQKAKESSKKV